MKTDHAYPQSPSIVLDRLAMAGVELPSAPAAVASYVPAVVDHDLVFVSGQLPFVGGLLAATGLVGRDHSTDDARKLAEVCAVNALAALHAATGDLDRVRRVLKLTCFVAAEHGYTEHPIVANGASDIMVAAFGDAGRHARAAVGCSSLPLGSPVEVDLVVRLEPAPA